MKSDVKGAFARIVSKDLVHFETIAKDDNGKDIRRATLNPVGNQIVQSKLNKGVRVVYWLVDGHDNWHCLASNHNAIDYIAISDSIEGCIDDVNAYFDSLKKKYQEQYGMITDD